MMTTTDVLIIGAGPTGLTLATILAHDGIQVRILDKKAGPTEESRALLVHAKTLELLDKLDLAEQAVAEGASVGTIELLAEGKRAGELSFMNGNEKRTPYPLALIYAQSQTEQLLLHNLAETGVRVEWSKELLSLEQRQESVQVSIRALDGREETIETRWLIGADGARSPVRHALSLGFEGETYEQPLFLADVDIESTFPEGQAFMDLTRPGFFAFFPMHGKQHFRTFGLLPPEFAEREKITLDELRSIIDTGSGMHVKILRSRWISIYRTHHRMTERFRVGRIFLAGDAAHIHSPAGGQGMNTGIGDAYNLAWKLALVVKGQAQTSLLDSYEAERMPFARAILRGSDAGFHLQSASGPLAQRIKMFTVPTLFRTLSAQPLLKQRAFWLLSQLWTHYRHSPAVAEARQMKKGPRAGERAPYGFFEAGPDAGKSLFTLLKGLDQHLLFFEGEQQSSNSMQQMENLQTLLNTSSVPIQLHFIATQNRALHKLYAAARPSLFLIRPDGHIAYRGPADDLAGLHSYLDRFFIQKASIPVETAERQEQTTS